MTDKRYSGSAEQLRSIERRAWLEVERVVDLCLSGTSVGSVLDIGVGSGLFAESFAQRGIAVSGIDANPEMVTAALHHVPHGHFEQAVAEALPFADGAFDLAFLGLVLHEVDDPGMVLREARRVAVARVAVLEWSHRTESFGPPVEHRLRSETIESLAHEAGLTTPQQFPLARLVLYVMDPRTPAR